MYAIRHDFTLYKYFLLLLLFLLLIINIAIIDFIISSVQFSSVQDGIYALGKAHMRSTQSLGSFPKVAFETVPMFI